MSKHSKADLKRKLEEKVGLHPERHILLCTGKNCEPDVAARTEKLLGKRLKALGAKTRCVVTTVECLRVCRGGPLALVYPEGTYYCGVTPEIGERIIDEHILRGEPVAEFAFASVPLVPILQNGSAEANTMADELKKGDKVEWDSSGGHSAGKVTEKVTEDTQIKGHKVKASKDDPQYRVESDKSGKDAIHKPDELKKAK